MQKNSIKYYHSKTNDIEVVYCVESSISYPEHNHISSYIIGLVLDGSFELRKNGDCISCKKGDAFAILPYEPHAISSKAEKYTTLTICISEKATNECSVDTILLRVSSLLEGLRKRKILSNQLSTILLNKIKCVIDFFTIAELPEDEAIDAAKSMIENEPEKSLEIEYISKQIYVSKYHLIRKFKAQIGLTPHRFQMQNRIRKSKQLLLLGNSITEVALAMGFCDQSHFIKWFRRILGLTPTEYVQSCGILQEITYN